VRILHVVASYLPAVRYGGTIVSVHALCRALAARGHDVHVFTTSVDGPGDSPVSHAGPVDLDGVRVSYFRSPRLRRLYWSPALGRALAAQVGGFDLVHTHAIFLWPLWAAARAARARGIPYVMSPRGMLEKELVRKRNPLLKSAWITLIERRNLESAGAIHVTSRREAVEAAAFGFRLPPVFEVPNGVDAPIEAPAALSPRLEVLVGGAPFVLFLGRVNWKKGLDRAIDALGCAPDVRLVIAGGDDEGYRADLEARAESGGVRSRVIFTGAVAGREKAALLGAALALVLPSYSENFGNVVLEAMAAGCPVVVTPEVGAAAIVRDSGGGLVVEGTAAALGGALSVMAADAAARQQMGERGRATARQFTWDAVAQRMEARYQDLVH
jgi:glycosyltransferase involved in cell wall biosynthesis